MLALLGDVILVFAQQFRQLGDARRDPSRCNKLPLIWRRGRRRRSNGGPGVVRFLIGDILVAAL